jgi:mRNA interferase MazF
MADPLRGEVWMVDLGLVGKVRPALVLSVPLDPDDRVLLAIIPHTTSVQGTRFEVRSQTRFLKPGVFDCQQVMPLPRARFIRKLGSLAPDNLAEVEDAVRRWLDL